jgi:hypothetical protein
VAVAVAVAAALSAAKGTEGAAGVVGVRMLRGVVAAGGVYEGQTAEGKLVWDVHRKQLVQRRFV